MAGLQVQPQPQVFIPPSLRYPLSPEAIKYYGIQVSKGGVWDLFQEITKHIEDVAPKKIKKKMNEEPGAHFVFCMLCEHDVLERLSRAKRCWQKLQPRNTTSNMRKHERSAHSNDARHMSKATPAETMTKYLVKHASLNHQVESLLAGIIGTSNLSFKVTSYTDASYFSLLYIYISYINICTVLHTTL